MSDKTDKSVKASDEITESCSNNTFKDATPEQLEEWINGLLLESNVNPKVENRELMRCLAINHLQMKQFIKKLDRKNSFVLWLTFFATFFCSIVAIINIWLFLVYKP